MRVFVVHVLLVETNTALPGPAFISRRSV